MCDHLNISQETSSDWQVVCADCGVVMSNRVVRYVFKIDETPCGCTVTMTKPSGVSQKKRFRNGYADAMCSAKKWIASQQAVIQEIYSESESTVVVQID